VFAYKVQRTPTDPSSYPVLLVSYLMGCTKYSDDTQTKLVKAYFTYIESSEGQQVAAQNAGSAVLPPGISKEVQPVIAAIGS
jgi:phosphate transport system substrate-binding protein